MQRDLLGEDLHLHDRLGRIAAEFAKARDTATVDEEHGTPAATAAGRTGLRRQLFDQIGQRIRAIGGDIVFVEFDHRRNLGFDLTADAFAGHDDRVLGQRLAPGAALAGVGRRVLGMARRGKGDGQRKYGYAGEKLHGRFRGPQSWSRVRPRTRS